MQVCSNNVRTEAKVIRYDSLRDLAGAVDVGLVRNIVEVAASLDVGVVEVDSRWYDALLHDLSTNLMKAMQ
jgi:hypothetical protein